MSEPGSPQRTAPDSEPSSPGRVVSQESLQPRGEGSDLVGDPESDIAEGHTEKLVRVIK